MNNCEYDLDTSGGLMEEIQKLIAPPVSEDASRRQKRGPKEFKKHGKAINHDYCDSCQEGGDLVCCDRCPVSFHLQCHDPPLEEDDIPPGEWICHRCKISPKPERDDDTSSTKSGCSTTSKTGNKYTAPSPIPIPMLVGASPLQTLAEAAKVLNPVQFELPKDVACTTPLPGSYKRKWWGRERNYQQKKQAHELDNGLVPLPAKLCYVCNKSCRVAPLLPCDFCPCLFHLDCLNPPLTSVPTMRWMCPNHMENVADEKLLKTVSVTERVKLWDRFNDRINQHVVKVDFLKKIHRQNPPFRIKYKHPRRRAATIPSAIKEFYKHPPDILPPPTLDSGGTAVEESGMDPSQSDTSQEEQELWLRSVVSLQTSVAQFLAKKQLERSSSCTDCKSDASKQEKPTASVQPMQNREHSDIPVSQDNNGLSSGSDFKSKNSNDQIVSNGPLVSSSDIVNSNGPLDVNKGAVSLLNPGCSSLNGDVEMTDITRSKASDISGSGQLDSPPSSVMKVTWPVGDKQTVTPTSSTQTPGNKNIVISAINRTNNVYTRVVPGVSGKTSGPTSILTPRAGSQAGKLGSSNILKSTTATSSSSTTKVINLNPPAASKIAITPNKSQQFTFSTGSQGSPAIISLNNTLQQCLEGTADLELSKLDEKLIQILAWQRLQQLVPTKSTDNQKKVSSSLNGLLTSPGLQEVQARAVLCPLSGRGEAIPMPYRTMSIGTGADMDVCLGQYGQCNFISAKHAFIFYDETSKHYELLNYSEHGTTVDNVLYSCDFSDKPATTPQPSAVVAAVRHLNSTSKPKMKADERLTMTSRTLDMRRHCNCRGSSSSLIGGSGAGWEGTAILHHGSYIKVGCIQFVFSIVDHALAQPIHGIKREPMSLLKSHLKGGP